MYTIAAIDDEVPAIQCIENILQGYDLHPFRLITARSAKEALGKLSKHKPDLLLVDIEMQDMDGFELIDAIHASCNPEAKAIIVTAYSQFAYCKKAIELRALDYILKPVKEGELLTAIERAFNDIEAGKKASDDQQRMGMRQSEQALQRYLMDRHDNYLQSDDYREATMYLSYPMYACAVVRINKCAGDKGRPEERLRQLLREKTSKAPDWWPPLMVMGTAPLEVAVVAGIRELGDWQAVTDTIRKASAEVGIHSLGLCSAFSDLRDIADQFQRCVQAARQQLFEPSGSPVRVHNAEASEHGEIVRDNDYRQVLSALAERIAQADEGVSVALMDCLRREKYVHYPVFREALLYLLTRIQQIAYEHGASVEPVSQLETVIGRSQTVEEIVSWAAAQAEEVIRKIRLSQATSAWRNVQRVIAYIDLHYPEPLTLHDVAAMASVHTAYFCDLFKKITGETYVEYLTRLRIDKAKQLLAEGRLSVARLSERVGYEDPNYFRRVFRKSTGMTPRQYRKRFV